MRNIQKGIDLIKEFEGLRLNAYLDPVGIPTIGYGTTHYPNGAKVKMGEYVTEPQAEVFLKYIVEDFQKAVELAIKVPVNDNQLGAIVSWTYNVGVGAMRSSTLIKVLNQGKYSQAADEFLKWNKATNQQGVKIILNGLTRRREAERDLFLEPVDAPQEQKDLDDIVTPSWFEPFKKIIESIFNAIFGPKETKLTFLPKHPDYEFARGFLLDDGVKESIANRYINHWAEKTKANYAYFFNYDKHCSEPRLYIFDLKDKSIIKRKSTHGIGSDPTGTGHAKTFSNVSGSKQSTLGLVMTAETYVGKNGTSLRLDGLDSTNSRMRERLIVIHGANYAETCGRSEGCPCIHHNWAQSDIQKIKLGSPGFHYHSSMVK